MLDIVQEWVRPRVIGRAIEVAWEDSVPLAQPPGSRTVDVFATSFRFRWPECLYSRNELLRRESPAGVVDYRTDEDHVVRARRERGITETYFTPSGALASRYEGTKTFELQAGEARVMLRDAVEGYVMHAPALLAMWIDDVGLGSFDITRDEHGRVRIRRKGESLTYFLSRDVPTGEIVLARMERLKKDGTVQHAFEYRGFRYVESCPYPIPGLRAEYRPSVAKVRMEGNRPVSVEFVGEVREVSVDRIVSYSTSDTLPDSVFEPELTGYTTFDESSGRLLDAEGNTIARATARRKLSRPGQWSLLIGSAGIALIVFAGGAWWFKRRAA